MMSRIGLLPSLPFAWDYDVWCIHRRAHKRQNPNHSSHCQRPKRFVWNGSNLTWFRWLVGGGGAEENQSLPLSCQQLIIESFHLPNLNGKIANNCPCLPACLLVWASNRTMRLRRRLLFRGSAVWRREGNGFCSKKRVVMLKSPPIANNNLHRTRTNKRVKQRETG